MLDLRGVQERAIVARYNVQFGDEDIPDNSELLFVAFKCMQWATTALHNYMHEFHAYRDHDKCNVQNPSIPAAHQLTQLRKLYNKNV
jgi:hypothetical protein